MPFIHYNGGTILEKFCVSFGRKQQVQTFWGGDEQIGHGGPLPCPFGGGCVTSSDTNSHLCSEIFRDSLRRLFYFLRECTQGSNPYRFQAFFVFGFVSWVVFNVVQHNWEPKCIRFSASSWGIQKTVLAFQKSSPGLFLKGKWFPILLVEPIFRNMEELGILQGRSALD
jgi:hypothetical protein